MEGRECNKDMEGGSTEPVEQREGIFSALTLCAAAAARHKWSSRMEAAELHKRGRQKVVELVEEAPDMEGHTWVESHHPQKLHTLRKVLLLLLPVLQAEDTLQETFFCYVGIFFQS